MRCTVCDADMARFRCRYCRSAYCSSACFKQHRDSNLSDARSRCTALSTAPSPSVPPTQGEGAVCAPDTVCSSKSRESAVAAYSDRTYSVEPMGAIIPAVSDSIGTVACHEACLIEQGEKASPESVEVDTAAVGSKHDANVRRDSASPLMPSGNADALLILSDHHLQALAENQSIRVALRSHELQRMLRVIDGSYSQVDALETAIHNSADFASFASTVMNVIAKAEQRRRSRFA